MSPRFELGKKYQEKRGPGHWRIEHVGGRDQNHLQVYTVEDPRGEYHFINESELAKKVRKPRIPGMVYLSASQVSSFSRCHRKWGFSHIEKIKTPSNPAQEFGTLVHDRLERYLLTGESPGDDDVGLTAQQGITKGELPAPADDLLVEHEFEIKILDGRAIFVGFIDCIVPPRENALLECIDHKTTKDLRYAMKRDQLYTDIQAISYMKYSMTQFIQTKAIAKWLYYCARPSKETLDGRPRQPRGFRAVPQVMTIEHVNAEWAKIEEIAEEMVTLRKTDKKANDLVPNTLACGDYGGCSYSNVCKLPEGEALGQLFSHSRLAHLKKRNDQEGHKNMPSLMEVIKKRKEAKGGEAIPINPPVVEEQEDELLAKAPVPQAPEKPKRKRRTKAEMEAARARGEVKPRKTKKSTAETPTTEAPPSNGHSTSSQALLETMFIVALDSWPLKGSLETLLLPEYLAVCKQAIQEKKEIAHWNLLDYRQGEQLLAAACQEVLKDEKPAVVLLCDSRSDEWKACSSVLTEHADIVIRGTG